MSIQLEWFSKASRLSLLEFLNNKLICFYEPPAIPRVQTWAIRSPSQRSSLASLITSWLYESFLSLEPFLHQFDSVSLWVLTRKIGGGRFGGAPKPGTSSVQYLSSSQGPTCLAGTSFIKGVPTSVSGDGTLNWWADPSAPQNPLLFPIPDLFCPSRQTSLWQLILLLKAVQDTLRNEKFLPCIWHEPVCGSQGTETCSWQTYLPSHLYPCGYVLIVRSLQPWLFGCPGINWQKAHISVIPDCVCHPRSRKISRRPSAPPRHATLDIN